LLLSGILAAALTAFAFGRHLSRCQLLAPIVEVVIKRDHAGQKLGIGLTGDVITSLQAGSPLDRWNQKHPESRITQGARLLAVNRIRDVAGMKAEIQQADVLHMQLLLMP
jgi:hypothetical protein